MITKIKFENLRDFRFVKAYREPVNYIMYLNKKKYDFSQDWWVLTKDVVLQINQFNESDDKVELSLDFSAKVKFSENKVEIMDKDNKINDKFKINSNKFSIIIMQFIKEVAKGMDVDQTQIDKLTFSLKNEGRKN